MIPAMFTHTGTVHSCTVAFQIDPAPQLDPTRVVPVYETAYVTVTDHGDGPEVESVTLHWRDLRPDGSTGSRMSSTVYRVGGWRDCRLDLTPIIDRALLEAQ